MKTKKSIKRKNESFTDNDFITKVAKLVKEQLNPDLTTQSRPVATGWQNFDLSPPSTSAIGSEDTTPPLHFGITRRKNDENDIFGKKTNLKFLNQKIVY